MIFKSPKWIVRPRAFCAASRTLLAIPRNIPLPSDLTSVQNGFFSIRLLILCVAAIISNNIFIYHIVQIYKLSQICVTIVRYNVLGTFECRLKFYKAGETKGVKFRGTRDLPTLTSFIADQLGSFSKVCTIYIKCHTTLHRIVNIAIDVF